MMIGLATCGGFSLKFLTGTSLSLFFNCQQQLAVFLIVTYMDKMDDYVVHKDDMQDSKKKLTPELISIPKP